MRILGLNADSDDPIYQRVAVVLQHLKGMIEAITFAITALLCLALYGHQCYVFSVAPILENLVNVAFTGASMAGAVNVGLHAFAPVQNGILILTDLAHGVALLSGAMCLAYVSTKSMYAVITSPKIARQRKRSSHNLPKRRKFKTGSRSFRNN